MGQPLYFVRRPRRENRKTVLAERQVRAGETDNVNDATSLLVGMEAETKQKQENTVRSVDLCTYLS